MSIRWSIALPVTVFLLTVSSPSRAFECPKHLDAAQTAIDKVAADMKGMMEKMPKEQMALMHALLDDAKMMLPSATHNHEKPQGAYDHARSIATADAALSYALAAGLLHSRFMNQ